MSKKNAISDFMTLSNCPKNYTNKKRYATVYGFHTHYFNVPVCRRFSVFTQSLAIAFVCLAFVL
jgi:hypothetical protein